MNDLLILLLLSIASFFILPKIQERVKTLEGASEKDIKAAVDKEKSKLKRNIISVIQMIIIGFFFLLIIRIILYMKLI